MLIVAINEHKNRLTLPTTIHAEEKELELKTPEDVLEMIYDMRAELSLAASELKTPDEATNKVFFERKPFERTLNVQSKLIQLIESGIFGKEAVFELKLKKENPADKEG
ncbi:hypothetical protein DRN38_01720 [Thermococci archaeon]|nr:MAG: hypothetical protein DRN38_01720 [Thermococci archaeon]